MRLELANARWRSQKKPRNKSSEPVDAGSRNMKKQNQKKRRKNTGTRMQMRERRGEREREGGGRCLLEKKFSVDLNTAALFSFVQRKEGEVSLRG